MHTLFYMACRQEVKILEFYSSEGAPEFPQAMNEVFKLESLSLEEFEKESVRALLRDSFQIGTKPELQGEKALSSFYLPLT